MRNNLFIAFEGIDGSGKSTQVRLLAERLKHEGHKVYATFEPTDGMIGSMLRNILKGNVTADQKTIAGLFLADRLDHLQNVVTGIVKKMSEGYTVITDRYYFSSYAYHSVHMDMDWVIAANKICADILRPDANIFIDVSPAVSMARINANRESTELFETLENLNSVRAFYREAFEKLSEEERVVFINGDGTIEDIAEDVWHTAMSLFQR